MAYFPVFVALGLVMLVQSGEGQRRGSAGPCLADVVFLVDHSGSIRDANVPGGPDNWITLISFVKSIISALDVGLTKTRVGLVTFSNDAEVIFNLQKHSTSDAMLRNIDGIIYHGGFTNTTGGFRVTRLSVYTDAGGDRPEVQDILILITDGVPTREETGLSAEIIRVKHLRGIRIIAIGVTNNINEALLKEIATDPVKEHHFHVSNFGALSGIIQKVVIEACVPGPATPMPPATPRPVIAGPPGAPGASGPRGSPGPHGAPGQPGASGMPGNDGMPGRHGRDGSSGGRGLTGSTGSTGRPGTAGKSGQRGPAGLPGGRGFPGPPGPLGPKGPAGPGGFPGPSGSTGSSGPTGFTGPQGHPGRDGSTGPPGHNGSPGSPGTDGSTGPMGSPGAPGFSGSTGAPGSPGPQGFPGNSGQPGSPGPRGLTGGTGASGNPGPPGTSGNHGNAGPRGFPGAGGPSGATGHTGSDGFPGGHGATGLTGATGKQGRVGDSGPPGRTGGTGAAGDPGPRGFPGNPGPVGLQGKDGATGQAGNSGKSGPAGQDGAPGFPGPTGPSGATGGTGPAGHTGSTGNTGKNGRTGATGSSGPMGPAGAQGHAGPPGLFGATGQRGNNGNPGRNGFPGPAGQSGRTGATGKPGQAGGIGSTGRTGATGRPGTAGRDGRPGDRGAPGKDVQLINECLSSNGGCSHQCVDTYDSYYCTCNQGYQIMSTSIMNCHASYLRCTYIPTVGLICWCTDTKPARPLNSTVCGNVNECFIGNGGCEHTCVDTVGGYHCSCAAGYVLGLDMKTCGDKNECKEPGACGYLLVNSCVNTIGSFYCIPHESIAGGQTAGDVGAYNERTARSMVTTLLLAGAVAVVMTLVVLLISYLGKRLVSKIRRKGAGSDGASTIGGHTPRFLDTASWGFATVRSKLTARPASCGSETSLDASSAFGGDVSSVSGSNDASSLRSV